MEQTTEDKNETYSNTDLLVCDKDDDEYKIKKMWYKDCIEESVKHILRNEVKTIHSIWDIENTMPVRIDDVDVKVEPDSGGDVTFV